MTPNEILKEIYRLPLAEQKALREKLVDETKVIDDSMIQEEFDKVLIDEGFLANLPDEVEENDDFEPVEFTGKPISETIIAERR